MNTLKLNRCCIHGCTKVQHHSIISLAEYYKIPIDTFLMEYNPGFGRIGWTGDKICSYMATSFTENISFEDLANSIIEFGENNENKKVLKIASAFIKWAVEEHSVSYEGFNLPVWINGEELDAEKLFQLFIKSKTPTKP